jgi:hypothetical protein
VADQLAATEAAPLLVVLSARQMAAASGVTFDAIAGGELAARAHAELTAAVMGARRRAYGQSWTFARQVGDVSGVPLLAVVVAMWAAEHAPSSVEKSQIW